MLDKVIHFSIKNKLVIGLFTLALVIWGAYSLRQLPIDAVPDITNNQAQVITVSPSLAAQEIERLVTFPVEQTMATIPGIEEVRSFSRFGLSVVTIVFKEHIDVYWARQQVNERLAEARTIIPAGAGMPELAPLTTGLGEIYQYVIHTKKGYEKKYSPMELRTIQDWIVRRQLLGTEGVADISSFGGYLKQYEIALDPDKLRSMNISIDEIFTALQKNNQNTGGAYIDKKPNAYFIRSEGLIGSIEDIERIVVKTNANGIPVLMRNVATVGYGHATRYGAMTRNGEGEVVGAVVMMLKGANSSKVIANVKERIAQIEKTLPEGVVIEPFLDRTKLVNNAIGTVTRNLAEGALIVIFVLVLLLGNLRAGLVVASVIPLAMLFAIAMMNLFGVSGNLMSLGAIDFGLIVDGAVIIVEATLHHLSLRNLNRRLSQQEMDTEVYESASKIRSSAAFGEIIILIVYLPILALVGVEGKMFRPMAQTVSFAILGAFILSLTYVPMISALFLNKNMVYKQTISDRIMAFFQRLYKPMILMALKRKVLVVTAAFILFGGSVLVFLNMGGEFIPTLDEGDFAVETRVLTGSSISQTIEAALRSAKILKEKFPEVKEVIGKIGSGEIPTDPMPVEACDLMVILKDKSEWTTASTRDELAEKMSEALAVVPGVTYGFQQPIQMRFNELMTGAKQDVVIKIYGEDLDRLTEYAARVGRLSAGIEGAQDLYIEQATGQEQIVIKFDRDRIAQFGLNIEDVNRVIRAGFAGESAGLVYEGEKRFDLVVRLEKENRQSMMDISNLFITAPNGSQVPVSQLAEVELKVSPNQIQRDDAKRRITVGFNVRGRDVESVVKEMQDKVNQSIRFSPGYYPTYGGTFKNLIEARQRLSVAVPVALLLIFLLLYFTFRSLKQSLLIFTAIPLSAIGGVFALWARGMPFSISAGVGFIALFGVAVLNGIVLIAEFNHLNREAAARLAGTATGDHLTDIILKGTSTRLRPVIMTALVASLGFLPMALSHGAGAEVQKPLATVVIGGLITATLLTLLVLPVLYFLFEKTGKKKHLPAVPVVMALLLLPAFGKSQSAPAGVQVLVDEALKNNAGLRAAAYELDYSKAVKRTSGDIGKTNIALMHGQYNSLNADNNISISQSIPFPTVFASQAKLNQALVKGSELKQQVTRNELIGRLKSAWYQWQYLQARQQLLHSQDSIYSTFLKAAELRLKTGETNLLEKTTAETRLMEVKNLLLQNASDIRVTEAQLQALVNGKYGIQLSREPLAKLELAFPADSAVYEQNPALAYVKQQVEISHKQQKLEAAKVLPDFNVGYFNQSLIGYQNVNGTDQYFDASKRFTGFQVGISVPLWFGPQAARVKAAGINREVVQSNYEQYQVTMQAQYRQAVQEYVKYQNTLAYYESSALPNATLLIKQADAAFRSGEIAYVEYLQALRNALSIRESYLLALSQYNQSVITLEFLTGKN